MLKGLKNVNIDLYLLSIEKPKLAYNFLKHIGHKKLWIFFDSSNDIDPYIRQL